MPVIETTEKRFGNNKLYSKYQNTSSLLEEVYGNFNKKLIGLFKATMNGVI